MSFFQTTSKLFTILRRTIHYIRRARVMEKELGHIPKEPVDQMMLSWASEMIEILRLRVKIKGTVLQNQPLLLLGNHLSYLDIPLLLSIVPARFIAKNQLARWPIFGNAMRCAGTLFVERGDSQSRKDIARQVGPRILENQGSIVVFPSGTTSQFETKSWRWKPFQIAQEFDLLVQPFRLRYTPDRIAAFIDDDAFLPHLWKLLRAGELNVEIEFHEPIRITDPKAQSEEWQRWAQEILR